MFFKKLKKIIAKNNSLVCVGLDADFDKIPSFFKKKKYPIFEFNKTIIEKTADFVCCYKPNSAFYEAQGAFGVDQLKKTCHFLKKNYPEIPIILDAKRGDIGSSNEGYVKYAFDYLEVDAITLHPYLGRESLTPFLKLKEKGLFILCLTSNPGAFEFQNLRYYKDDRCHDKKFFYQIVAEKVVFHWNENKNCALVVGASYPEQLAKIRQLVGEEIWFLVPGIGAQGGDLSLVLKAGLNSKGEGLIINTSRSIIFAKDPKKEVVKLKDEINKHISFSLTSDC